MFTACMIEKEIGTIRMVYRFWVLGFITLSMFVLICVLLGLQQVSAGLWPVMFFDLVYICMKNPNQVRK
jgi:hypothetical protein